MMKVLVCVLVLAVVSVHSASLTKKELLEELLDLLERDGPELDKRGAIYASRNQKGDIIKLYPQKQKQGRKCPCVFDVFWKTGEPPASGPDPNAVYNTQEFSVGEANNRLDPIELKVDEGEDYTVVICGSVSATVWVCKQNESKCAGSGVNFDRCQKSVNIV